MLISADTQGYIENISLCRQGVNNRYQLKFVQI